jgi:hypothetical protein
MSGAPPSSCLLLPANVLFFRASRDLGMAGAVVSRRPGHLANPHERELMAAVKSARVGASRSFLAYAG